MMRRLALLFLVFVMVPALALANEGILLLAHNGTPEWNAQVKDIAAKVNAQKPAEALFGTPTRAAIAAAVDRLAKRGVTDVLAVPFFLSTALSPEDFTGHAVPARIAPAVATAPVLHEIALSLAQDVSPEQGLSLVLFGHGGEDDGTSWKVDLNPAAQRLNRTRHFRGILVVPGTGSVTELEQQQIHRSLSRLAAPRIIVVPAVAGVPAAAIAQRLEGFTYDLAKGGILADARLVEWLAQLK